MTKGETLVEMCMTLGDLRKATQDMSDDAKVIVSINAAHIFPALGYCVTDFEFGWEENADTCEDTPSEVWLVSDYPSMIN